MARWPAKIENWLAKLERFKNEVLVAYEERRVQEGTSDEPG